MSKTKEIYTLTITQQVRAQLSKLIELERPLHHKFQQAIRTPQLDTVQQIISYFGSTSSFVLLVPILFGLGTETLFKFTINFTIVMSLAVLVTNVLKDSLELSRPLAPVEKIDLISSHSLEFGFPSTHTTLAVSLGCLLDNYLTVNGLNSWLIKSALTSFVTSIVSSRFYCGMHSLCDIFGGVGLGLTLISTFLNYLPIIHHYLFYWDQSTATLVGCAFAVLAIYILPIPKVKGCPCYSDSLVVIGVLAGLPLAVANWTSNPLHNNQLFLNWPTTYTNMGMRMVLATVNLAIFELVYGEVNKLVYKWIFNRKLVKDTELVKNSYYTATKVIKYFLISILAINWTQRFFYALNI